MQEETDPRIKQMTDNYTFVYTTSLKLSLNHQITHHA